MMKTSIPRLKVIRPKHFDQYPVRNHLSRCINSLFEPTPQMPQVVGYALVTFYADGQRGCAWSTSGMDSRHAVIDMPDAVRNVLKERILADRSK